GSVRPVPDRPAGPREPGPWERYVLHRTLDRGEDLRDDHVGGNRDLLDNLRAAEALSSLARSPPPRNHDRRPVRGLQGGAARELEVVRPARDDDDSVRREARRVRG